MICFVCISRFLFVCLLFYFYFLFVCLFIAFAQVFHQNSLEKNEGEIHGLCCEMWSNNENIH